MVEIRPLSIDDRSLVTRYFHRFPPEISEFTFTNLFVWRKSRPIGYMEIKDALVFFIRGTSDATKWIQFGPPVGPASPLDIMNVMEDKLLGIVRLPKKSLIPLSQAGIKSEPDRDNADYVYQVADLAELSGRRYAKKRNHIKHCLKKYRCEYENINADNLDECRTMLSRWCHTKNCETEPGLCGEFVAINEMFDRHMQLELIGGAIRVDGEIKAFAFGEQLNPTTAVWHFEKAMPEVRGLAQLINQWFAKFSLQQFEYVNREQDLGIAGLRQSKESYYPHHLLEKFNVPLSGPLMPLPLEAKGCPGLC